MQHVAHRVRGGYALIPEIVAANQKAWDKQRKTFVAIPCDATGKPNGKQKFRAVVRGDLFGLYSTGTGCIVISSPNAKRDEA